MANTDGKGWWYGRRASDSRDLLRQAIGRLPYPQRQVAELRLLREQSVEQIAATLGMSVTEAEELLDAAVERLRRGLGGASPRP